MVTEEQIAVLIPAKEFARLIVAVESGKLPRTRSHELFDIMVSERKTLEEAVEALGITTVDESSLNDLCQELIEANPKIVSDIKAGKTKAIGALVGQARKKNPNVDPNQIRDLCLNMIETT